MAYGGPPGGEIRATLAISQDEARTGSTRTLTLPGGRRVTVSIPSGTRNGEQIRLTGQGEPAWEGGPAGDLILTISIPSFPASHSMPGLSDATQNAPTEFIPWTGAPSTSSSSEVRQSSPNYAAQPMTPPPPTRTSN